MGCLPHNPALSRPVLHSLNPRAARSNATPLLDSKETNMNGRTLTLTVGIAVLGLLCFTSAASKAQSSVTQSATGSGKGITANGDSVTFSFSALRDSDGSVQGQAQFINRTTREKLHLNITCVSVVGSLVRIGGEQVIPGSTAPAPVYNFVAFDGGEGQSGSGGMEGGGDFMSLPILTGDSDACAGFSGEVFQLASGNIQVRTEECMTMGC